MPTIQVARLRDLAGLLRRLNSCGSRHEAVSQRRVSVSDLVCARNNRAFQSVLQLSATGDECVDSWSGWRTEQLALNAVKHLINEGWKAQIEQPAKCLCAHDVSIRTGLKLGTCLA